ncbi:MAG: hypothetical protein GXO82_03820 [Chlorobi bacterium]|nr:hypothetical protein [Chlorobiota bacterium]
MAVIVCSRCGQEKEVLGATAFYTGEVREKLLANACRDCWQEWLKVQLMLVNEYRLDLTDPRTDEILDQQVLAFFNLGEPDTPDLPGSIPPPHSE